MKFHSLCHFLPCNKKATPYCSFRPLQLCLNNKLLDYHIYSLALSVNSHLSIIKRLCSQNEEQTELSVDSNQQCGCLNRIRWCPVSKCFSLIFFTFIYIVLGDLHMIIFLISARVWLYCIISAMVICNYDLSLHLPLFLSHSPPAEWWLTGNGLQRAGWTDRRVWSSLSVNTGPAECWVCSSSLMSKSSTVHQRFPYWTSPL